MLVENKLYVLGYGSETWTFTRVAENLLNLRSILVPDRNGDDWRIRYNRELYDIFDDPLHSYQIPKIAITNTKGDTAWTQARQETSWANREKDGKTQLTHTVKSCCECQTGRGYPATERIRGGSPERPGPDLGCSAIQQ